MKYFRSDYDFNQTGRTWQLDTYGEGGANFTIPFTYMSVGVYTATMISANEVR